MRSLSQTREYLSAEDSFLEQPGQLLDKALAKQIARRESELDSLTAPIRNNVSVIVRCSTPDPEATYSKGNPDSHFPDQVLEGFSIPVNYLFESFQESEAPPLPPRHPEAPPLPPRHPVFLNNTLAVHPLAPEVPRTPPRHSHSQNTRTGETSLLEDFRSPRTSALLEPLIKLNGKEVTSTSTMADLNRMKDECDEKLMLFDNLLSR